MTPLPSPHVAGNPNLAVEHLLWIAARQGEGLLLIDVRSDDGRSSRVRRFFSNTDPGLDGALSGFLAAHIQAGRTIFYSVNAFCRPRAVAANVVPGRIAHVDGDSGLGNDVSFPPSRVVQSSAGHFHLFWELEVAEAPARLQEINKALLASIGGDAGGHSPAKLFRLPGTLNKKRDRPELIVVTVASGPKLDTRFLLLPGSTMRATEPSHVPSDAHTLESIWNELPYESRVRLRQKRVYAPFALTVQGKSHFYEGDDRSAVIWGLGKSLVEAGLEGPEVIKALEDTVFWQSRDSDGKAEDPHRLLERLSQSREKGSPPGREMLGENPATWVDPPPVRSWLIPDIAPMNKVTGLYGDGGTGKTLLAMQLAVAVATGGTFLEMQVLPGRVYALLAENDRDDSHLTLNAICSAMGLTLTDLGKMRIASRAGLDNALMALAQNEFRATDLFQKLLQEVRDFQPTLIVLDTAADLFGGNENDRHQVRRFLSECCTQLAVATGAAVVLCAHPSVAGLRSNEGSGGSTAWNNSMRSRLYLRREISEQDHEDDPDVRILELKKANLSRRGLQFRLRWSDGVLLLDDGKRPARPDKYLTAAVAEVERAFADGEPWSAHPQAKSRWLGKFLMRENSWPKARAANLIDRLLIKRLVVEVLYDHHRHRNGLCTPAQAREEAAKHKGEGAKRP